MGRKKVQEVPTAPVVEVEEEVVVKPHVVTKPFDGTVNDRVAQPLPSLDD